MTLSKLELFLRIKYTNVSARNAISETPSAFLLCILNRIFPKRLYPCYLISKSIHQD
uniref:Uncharacterized protein n=1 Tax=Anguilla anguilla TaxID=7936 RepID=A0A0E9TF24_ANGAN